MTFYDYMEAAKERKDLSIGARCLLYDLIIIWNRWYKRRSPDGWFNATDHGDNRFVIGENISSVTYTRYRNELIEKGCIDYRRGFSRVSGKGRASRYKLLLKPVSSSKKEIEDKEVTDSIV